MAPNNATPRCARFEIVGGPDLTRLTASYSVRGEFATDRVAFSFNLLPGSTSSEGVRRGNEIERRVLPVAWIVDGLFHESGGGHDHMMHGFGKDEFGRLRAMTGHYNTGKRAGTLIVWDADATPPHWFAMSDGEVSRLVPHGS